MKILFATDRMHRPDDFSGSVTTTHELAAGLGERGHDCRVMASLPTKARHYLATIAHRITGRRRILEWTDEVNGYPTHRGVSWRFPERVVRHMTSFRPDVLILDSTRQLAALDTYGVQMTCEIVTIFHDVYFTKGPRQLPRGFQVVPVANSPMTAGRISEHFGIQAAVVPPIIDTERYETTTDDARFITLISPKPIKGLDLVIEMAGMAPDIQFLIVEGIPMPRGEWEALRRRTDPLGNVTLRRSTEDMRTVYRDTLILLAPSQVAETFGRVVPEAHVSGIPTFVRDVGALPWVAGDGGVVMPAEAGAKDWVEALQHVLGDPERYGALSEMARRNARRPEFQKEVILDTFEDVLRGTVRPGRSA